MAARTPGTKTPLAVSPRGQTTPPKLVRARLKLVPGSAPVTSISLYTGEEIERLVEADRLRPRARAALRRRWSLRAGAQRRDRG
jgi:hypothetical protein